MKTKKYSSYAEIENELEFLKVEKELNIQKIFLSVQKTKESFSPQRIVKGVLGTIPGVFLNSSQTLLKMGLPLLINFITKRKRGF